MTLFSCLFALQRYVVFIAPFHVVSVFFLVLSRRLIAVVCYNASALFLVLFHAFFRKRSIKSRLAFKNSVFVAKEDQAVKNLMSSLDSMEVIRNSSSSQSGVKNRGESFTVWTVLFYKQTHNCNEAQRESSISEFTPLCFKISTK